MNQYIYGTVLVVSVLMTGCTVTQVSYAPDYDNDYVYSVGYVGTGENWDQFSYPGYTWGGYPWYGSAWGY